MKTTIVKPHYRSAAFAPSVLQPCLGDGDLSSLTRALFPVQVQ